MELPVRDDIFTPSLLSLEEDIMINKIMLIHDPDGARLDVELLLQSVENVICYASTDLLPNNPRNIEVSGLQEPLSHIIYRISREMIHYNNPGERDLQTRTLIFFYLVQNYKWDAKVVLILAAFAINYGGFSLLMQLYTHNPLAALIAILKHLPSDMSAFRVQFKAMDMLFKTMMDVTKCIIQFEGLPVRYVELDAEVICETKSQIYVASYWVVKSALACSFQVMDIKKSTDHQQQSNSISIAACELSSFVYKLSSIFSRLRRQVDFCYEQIDRKLHQKLFNLFEEVHVDNQEALTMLFALNDDFPLKDGSSQSKVSVSEFHDKIVMVLVSKPDLTPTEVLFLLMQQICDQQNMKLKRSYECVWIPISQSDMWDESETDDYDFISNFLPLYSIRQPWSLHKAVVKYIKQVWSFKDEPLLVVLDSHGVVTNSNAFDMVLIWAARAYPFSASRETQLWDQQKWTIQFMVDNIDPLLTKWVEEGRDICIYGGDNLDWIREFNVKLRKITNAGMQLKIIYVGTKNSSEQVNNILATINHENLSDAFSPSKLQLFWHRLKSMRQSKLRTRNKTDKTDHILEELAALLDFNDNEKLWAVFGTGGSIDIVKLQGSKLIQCLDNFSVWGENVALLGFLGALKTAGEPTHPDKANQCNHSNIVPYEEGLLEKIMSCDKCKFPMAKFIVYQ